MLAKLKQFSPLINLIPNTAIQFLDFGFNLNEARVSRAFLTETGADGRAVLTALYPDDASGQFVTQDGRAVQPEQVYSLNAAKAAGILDSAWIPIPFLRIRALNFTFMWRVRRDCGVQRSSKLTTTRSLTGWHWQVSTKPSFTSCSSSV